MTATVRIVNTGNCAGDVVTVGSGPDHGRRQMLARGEVSENLSADQTLRLECVHEGEPRNEPIIDVWDPSQVPARARATWERYAAAVGGTTFDGKPLPDFTDLGERQKAGWAAAGGVPLHLNPYIKQGSC